MRRDDIVKVAIEKWKERWHWHRPSARASVGPWEAIVEWVDRGPSSMAAAQVDFYHYSTRMATFTIDSEGRFLVLEEVSIGHGSVSDQRGMNGLFRVMNMPYAYYRAGGARIVFTDDVRGELQVA